MRISNFFKWLNELTERYFPDRQLYFRSNGEIRYISISKKNQIISSATLAIFFIWCSVISYNYIYLDNILIEKDSEVSVVNRNYAELENQFSELKNSIQKSTNALKQRQQYIAQVLEEEGKTLLTDDQIIEEVVDSIDQDVTDDTENDQEARNNIRSENLDRIFVDLKRIEMAQNKAVKTLNEKMDQRFTFLKETLSNAGLAQEKILELATDLPSASSAQGGPFIALTNGINEASFDNSLFDKLYFKRAGLTDLETALKYLPIATPPEKHYLSSRFGVRRDPITRKWANHKGIDMAGWRGTNINAGGDGIVTKSGRNGAFGLFIEINHGNGFKTKYGHLSKLKVKKGEKVKANQLIGLMGSTGRSTSSHLHYEIWFNGKPIDPLKVIKAAKDVQKIKQQKYNG